MEKILEAMDKDIIGIVQTIIFALQAGIFYFQLSAFKQQAGFMRDTVDQMEKAFKLASDEFISIHRPRIAVRHMRIDNDKIKFEIKNIGETQAKLLSRCVGVQTTAPVFQRPERNPETFKEDVTLPSGQGIGREFDYSKPSDTTSTNIWCFGSIVYKDGAGMVRTTGFCRSYDKDTERFTPLQDSDYEYAY